ncbi:MAG TPA: hypothetical protein VKQ72_07715 [Aggregatilineales bacterium]|nr:hypothetical protein [Aggregatilineales bacterium]
MADALRERRESVERIIQKLKELDQAVKSYNEEETAPSYPVHRVASILSRITTFSDMLKWAKKNFDQSDVLLLETKFKTKLRTHPEREEDANYCRLVTLILYLMATTQTAKVYGDFSHRAISDAFATHLDMYHTLHLLEIACHLGEVALQIYVMKANIAEILANCQDAPLSEAQEKALARLCLLPEDGLPLEDNTPLFDLCFSIANESSFSSNGSEKPDKANPFVTTVTRRENLSTISDAVDNFAKGSPALMQRYKTMTEEPYFRNGRPVRHRVPYYAPDLSLSLSLRNVIRVADIKRTAIASPALIDKLTELWQIFLPMHIDLAEMADFQ